MKETTFCKECGEKVSANSQVCPNCGRRLKVQNQNLEYMAEEEREREEEFHPFGLQKKAYNKWISFFLALFLGWLGAHKFYEEKYFVGILYLFTWGLFGIGWIVDVITIFRKPNPYYLWK